MKQGDDNEDSGYLMVLVLVLIFLAGYWLTGPEGIQALWGK